MKCCLRSTLFRSVAITQLWWFPWLHIISSFFVWLCFLRQAFDEHFCLAFSSTHNFYGCSLCYWAMKNLLRGNTLWPQCCMSPTKFFFFEETNFAIKCSVFYMLPNPPKCIFLNLKNWNQRVNCQISTVHWESFVFGWKPRTDSSQRRENVGPTRISRAITYSHLSICSHMHA